MRVAVLDDYQCVAGAYADWSDLDVDFVPEHLTGDALVARLADREIVVAMCERTPFPRAVLARLSELRLLVTTGMRNASIDLPAATELGITVSGTRGLRTPTTELTWALIFGLVRPVGEYDTAMRAGGWQRTVGGDLAGRTLGLVGLGRQCSAVAAVGTALGMDVIAWSPHLTPKRAAGSGVRAVSRADLFAQADIVSLHLVNSARALLIDQAALRTAIEGRWLAGVALACTTSSRCRPTTGCGHPPPPCCPHTWATSRQPTTASSSPTRQTTSPPTARANQPG